MKNKKRAASVTDPTIEAIVGGMFRFENANQAANLLGRIQKQYVISKEQKDVQVAGATVRIWIRGFGVTPEEREKGFRGHFALITVQKTDNGKFTLVAEKLNVPLKMHPQKERPKLPHPNWGHPILRAAKKGKTYPTIEAARAELMRLHEEFPETTIPGTDKLHMMIYSREAKPPIQKMTVRISVKPDNTFVLEASEQRKKLPTDTPIPTAPPTTPSAGKYTSLVSMQRKRKGKK